MTPTYCSQVTRQMQCNLIMKRLAFYSPIGFQCVCTENPCSVLNLVLVGTGVVFRGRDVTLFGGDVAMSVFELGC